MLRLLATALLVAAVSAAPLSKCAFDVAFLFDSSESIGDATFKKELTYATNFLKESAKQLNVPIGGPKGIRAALVPYSSYGHITLPLLGAEYAQDHAAYIESAINGQKFFPGLSNPADALDKVRADVFTSDGGDRAAFPNVVVLISDGSPTTGTHDPVAAANKLRNDGATVISVGVCGMAGTSQCATNYAMLNAISGGSSHVFNLTSPLDNMFRAEPFATVFSACNLK